MSHAQWLYPPVPAYYAMPDGEVITDAEWRQRPSWRQVGARLLPRAERRRLVGFRFWRELGARAPRRVEPREPTTIACGGGGRQFRGGGAVVL